MDHDGKVVFVEYAVLYHGSFLTRVFFVGRSDNVDGNVAKLVFHAFQSRSCQERNGAARTVTATVANFR